MRVLHVIVMLIGLVLPQAALAETGLRALSTMEAGKGFQAVGRLNLGDRGFCTGALIAPDLVLTAAHCLYDPETGAPYAASDIQFLAGWRNGRAEAYRGVYSGVAHPRYSYLDQDEVRRVAYDLALIRLEGPIRLPGVTPFATAAKPRRGAEVGVVSYAQDRAEAPSLQEVCHVMAGRPGILMLTCSVNFGSSGAPVFSFAGGRPEIVSVVSSKAELRGKQVALGVTVDGTLDLLQKRLDEGESTLLREAPVLRRFGQSGSTVSPGAKFVRP